ncbi:tyrosine-type recombinase/integrase [Comamonas terrigena]|uniref:tyrosine-type recombinase/integrase n=1 Tax=Comamonas terrigena TaxID=32013 RepID=UPI0028AB1F0F|nr:tyrosine-type recombinase/integrase [Comamonas terrigena]
MAKPRQKASGKWEIGLRHPSLPQGRKYFTFDTEEEAVAYSQQWKLMKHAGLPPPRELLEPDNGYGSTRLSRVLGEWEQSGYAAPSQILTISTVNKEVGTIKLMEASYKWLQGYIQWLKVEKQLTPQSIRHRVQCLGRAIDEYLRNHPALVMQNPTRLLPKGYSAYSDTDTKLATANGGEAKVNVQRDRRLCAGEEEKILQVLSGYERPDRPRGLQLQGGNALLTLFCLILGTGLRLKEAATLKRSQIDMDAKIIRAQSSKQWRGKVAFRDVPMSPAVHRALDAYLSTRSVLPAAWLFPFMEEEGVKGYRTVSSRLSGRFRIAFEYMEIMDLHEHDLRHEATCRWLEMRDAGGNFLFRLEEVNRIMGWSPGSAMAHRYASFRAEDMAAKLWQAGGGLAAAAGGA